MMNCKEATRLVSEAQDRPLDTGERLPLEFHLLICTGCRNYRRQIEAVHAACQHMASGQLPEDDPGGDPGTDR